MSHEYFYGTLLCCRRRARRVTTPRPRWTVPRPRRRTQNKPSLAGDYAGYTGAEEAQEADMSALATDMGTRRRGRRRR